MTAEPSSKGRRRPAAKPDELEAESITDTSEKGIVAAKGRATPGRRQAEAEEEQTRGFFGRIVDYIQGVRSELDKVAWPNREQVRSLFTIVVIVTIIAAMILGMVAFMFNELFVVGLRNPMVFVIFGAVVGAAVFLFSRRSSESGSLR